MRNAFLTATTFIVATLLLATGAMDRFELPVRDAVLRLLPERAARTTVIVAIDEASLRAIGPWPWPRTTLAQLIDRAAAARAGGVVLDVLLPEGREGDAVLATAMRRMPTIAVSVVDDHGDWLLPNAALHDAATAAHGTFELDHDGILRRLASTKQSNGRALVAMPVEAASLITGAPVPIGTSISPAFRTRARAIPRISAAEFLRGAPNVAGKLVFIGPTALGFGDRVLTPTSDGRLADPGVTVHAAATESIIAGDEIHPLPPIAGGMVAAIAISILLLQAHARRIRRAVVTIALVAIAIAAGVLLLDRADIAIPFVTLLAFVVVGSVAIETAAVTATLRRSHVAATRMESGLGIAAAEPEQVAPRLEVIAERLAETRAQEAEAKRVLAHELKTPLASMRGLTQLLGRFELSETERQRVASLLEMEAGKLQSMVTGLLDLEQFAQRDFGASAAVVDLGDLVRRRVDFLRASSDRELLVSAQRDLLVRGDAALLERAIDNLVGNALKYTEAPVIVRAVASGDGAVVEVEDHGPGIDDAERKRIFDRFFRGSTAAGTRGLGLGLSLVAEIARWHGGAVAVEQGSDGGSLFRIRLPRASALARAGGL